MNTRIAKYSIAIILLVTFIAASLMTRQPANSVVNVPTPDSASPQPQATQPVPYIPRSEPSKIIPPSQPVPQQVVIQFEPQTTDAERTEYIESIGGTVTESIDSLDTVVVNVSEETAQEPLPESPVVTVSEPDYYVSSLDDLAPINDPRYMEQWALPAIGAPSAWAQLPADAPKVTVAVIDSGICADHPDLAGRILAGWDFLESDATPQDDFGHGCSVSGVIAANMNDGIGIAGVAPNAQIMPLRVLNANGVGSYSDVAAAIVYAADNGAKVINLSLGGSNPSSTLENAVNYAISKGVILVAAAGNSGTEGALYPAAYPDVVAVGSVDPNLQHSSFSNYGSQVDIWAPGRDILTTKRDGSYGLVSGTSFAAPYVAGADAITLAIGKNLVLDGNVLNIQISTQTAPTPTTSINNTPIPTAMSTQVGDENKDYIVYSLGNFLYAQSIDSTNNLRELGQINNGANIVLSSNSDVYDIQFSPLKSLPPNKYGFYHGVWSPNREIFVFIEMEDQELGYRIRSINTVTDDEKNLLSDSIGNERGYLIPLAWRNEETVVLVERYMIDSLEKLRLWDLNVLTGEIVSHPEIAIPQLFGKSFILSSGKTVFIGIDPASKYGYTYNAESNTLAHFSLSIPLTTTGDDEEDTGTIDVIGIVQESELQQLPEQIQQQNVSGSASRPSPFIYWPFADNVRPGILQYPDSNRSRVLKLSYYADHFGTDVSVPKGTIVYAAATGWVVGVYNGCPNHTQNYSSISLAPDNCVPNVLQGYSNVSGANNNDDDWPLSSETAPGTAPDGFGFGVHNWGNSVMIQHTVTVSGQSKTWFTTYGHLNPNSIVVSDESPVSRGDPVAQSGHNGKSSLPHLHFEVRNHLSTGYYSWDDPWGSLEAGVSSPDQGSVWVGGNGRPTAANGSSGGGGGGGTGKGCDQISYNGVELYENANCNKDTSGKTKSFSSATGLTDIVSDFNDITSSIYVASGWSAKVFEKSIGEGGGSWRCVTGSMWDLSVDKYTNGDTNRIINNDISSVQIYNNNNCSGGGGGGTTGSWSTRYFSGHDHWWDNNNTNNQMCTETITSTGLDKNYGSASPCSGGVSDNWVAEYNANINFSSGYYVFQAQNDDGLKLWVNNTNILERGGSQSLSYVCPARYLSGSVPIRAILNEEGGDARVKITWTTDTSVCNPPGSFNKSSPSSGVTGQPTNPTLSWGSSSGANNYSYCIDTSNNNSCDTGWQGVGNVTSKGLSGLTAGTTYYWHVRSNSDGGESYSNSNTWWSFTVQSNAPGAFNKTGPSNSSTGQSTSPSLAWGPSSGAASYQYCIDTVNDNACTWISNNANTSITLSNLSNNTTYYWHARALSSDGTTTYANGSSTAFWSFTTAATAPGAPSLSSPGSGSSNPYNYDLTFQWNISSGATEYQIEWWGGPYTTMQPCGWSASTSCHIGAVIPGNTYFWHVRARNSYGTSGWSSPTWTFSIQNAPLPDLVPSLWVEVNRPVLIANTTGYPWIQEEVISNLPIYISWEYKNVGQGDAGPHRVTVDIDNVQYVNNSGASVLVAGDIRGKYYEPITANLSPGPHTVKMTIDADNQVSESNESNNVWTGIVYWRDPKIIVNSVFTTDDLGPATSENSNVIPIADAEANAYKDIFNSGDAIRLYLDFTSEFPDDRTFTGEWQVINPAGRIVPELSSTETTTLGSGGWWWWINRTIPTYSIRGEYTFIGKITYNGVPTTQTTTFTVTGDPTVEVYDVSVADVNGNAASLEAIPQRAIPSDVGSKSVPTFNSGDSIRLYIDAYNDVVEGESATFTWEVIDPWNRPVEALQWNGDLNSWLGHTWWSLSPTIPSDAITGDYIFTGYITHGDRTTFQSQTFHVNGSAGPSNDSFGSPVVVSSVPFTGTKDTWGATVATTDPTPTCGSEKNSNSVWYRYTAPANGLLEVDTWGSDYDTVLAVWTGTISNLTLVQCNDDSNGYLQAWLGEVPVSAGVTYYIEVMDFGGPGGGYLDLYVNFAQTTSNNDFNTPTVINVLPYNITQDTRGTTKGSDDPTLTSCNRLPGQASVWYRYTPVVNGNLLLDTKGSNYDTLLAVWTGPRGNLVSQGCNDDIGDVNGTWDSDSILTIPVSAGTAYYIEASTFNGFIDINGASAMELQDKQEIFSEDALASSLQDKKAELDKNGGLITDLQSERSEDVSAQFWGGQLQLHIDFESKYYTNTSRWTSSFDLSHGWTVADFVRTVGDVNGDGRADLVGFGLDGVYVALSNGTSFEPVASKWTSSFDLSHGWTVADFVRTVGDVNGDGKADLVGFGLDGVYVALSNGTNFEPVATKWTSSFDLSHGWTVKDFVRTVGDVNGDGKADLIGFGLDGVYVALSNGTSFEPVASQWTSSFDLSHGWTVKDFVRTVGDVNGDGKADLVGFGLDGVYVALSNGTSFAPAASKWTSALDLSHGWTVAGFVRTVGDVNSDGKADLVGFGLNGVYVTLSNGTNFEPAASQWTSSFDLSHGWTVASFVRTVGDVNKDGRVDLVGFGLDGVYIATAK